MSYPPQPPVYVPPKKSRQSDYNMFVIIIVLIFILIAAAVIFAFFSFIFGFIDGGSHTTHPVVSITAHEGGADPNATANLTVSLATAYYSFSSYRIRISMDGSTLDTLTPSPGVVLNFGSSVRVIVKDSTHDGELGSGDVFMVYGMAGVHTWRFMLIWAGDDFVLSTTTWYTP